MFGRRHIPSGSSLVKPIGDAQVLNKAKRIDTTKKFSKIKSNIVTGKHANNIKPQVDRRNELYERVKCETLQSWIEIVKLTESVEPSFVVVDVREQPIDESILGAIVFTVNDLHRDRWPINLIARTISSCKNPINHVIFFDNDDPSIGPRPAHIVATEVVSKGRLNAASICVLTGGLAAFKIKAPHLIIDR